MNLSDYKKLGLSLGRCSQCGSKFNQMINYDNRHTRGVEIPEHSQLQLIYFKCINKECNVETYWGDLGIDETHV